MPTKVPAVLLAAAALVCAPARAQQDCSLFVDYGAGSDKNKGTSVDQPFKTLQRAVWWGSDDMGDRTICLRSGVHRLSQTVNIDVRLAHAGRGLVVTTYGPDLAAGRGRAVLSGGIMVGPFTRKNDGDTWLTATPPTVPHHRPSLLFAAQTTTNGGSAPAVGVGCRDALAAACALPTCTTLSAQAQAAASCLTCAGLHQRSLRSAGCSPADIAALCARRAPAGAAWLQRARLPKPHPADAGNRFTGDRSTFKYTGPIAPLNESGVWPAVDSLGFRYNHTDSYVTQLPLHRQDEVQVLHFHSWTAFWSNISSVEDGILRFQDPTLTAVGQWSKQGGQRYLLENVREGMSEPGDWYWDEGAAEIRLIPPAAAAATVGAATPPLYAIAPQLSTLLRVLNGASCVTLVDLELSHASGGDRVGVYHANNAAVSIGGAAARPSTDIKLQRVAVRDCGGAGIYAKVCRRTSPLHPPST
jgi:hypothetical protein